MARNWKPSKADRAEYARQMQEIESFCKENGIEQSMSGDSYYFTLEDGRTCRVSNHTVEASNAGMWAEMPNGELVQTRQSYHTTGYDIEIIASKTRIIEIYKALLDGKELDKRGREKKSKK